MCIRFARNIGSEKGRLMTVEQKYLDKADVLIEALPYIRRFHDKVIVVKYGGAAMVDDGVMRRVMGDIVLLKLVGFKPIVVHGGGKEINRWLERIGIEPHFENGLRVTDEPTMEMAEMVLYKVNKELVSMAESFGVKVIGVSGKDGALMRVNKAYPDGEDLGYVGNIDSVRPEMLEGFLEDDYIPIVCPIGLGEEFHSYNINADVAACAIAKAMHAEKLAFLSDIEGVYRDPKDPSTLISELHASEARQLIEDGTVGGGMVPKLQGCIDAVENGVTRVHILDGRIRHCLLLEIFTNKGVGSSVIGDNTPKFHS